jgi:glutamyl-tRNA reductase|uniref:glutamyl-tRNA reductase n=1 Tax=Cephaloticoccus sp. TaxID=1985742 RepID=UPI00404953E7
MNSVEQTSSVFFVLGATHHEAPITVREKLAVNDEAVGALHLELARLDGLREFAVLSTCNRTEFYGVAANPEISAGIQRIFCDRQGFPETEFEAYRMQLQGRPAVQHLLEVASGLDSQLVGETEIFGQLKEAYALAQNRQSTGPILNRLFQKAFQAAKHVRTHTAITTGRVSVANVAVDLAQSIFGDIGETRILLLGAGEIGEKTARAFQSRGAGSLTVSSRNIEHAMALAKSLDATALPFENREPHLGEFDIVVCSTAAPGMVLSLESVRTAMKRRTARPLFFIDLALPRDVEPAVAELPNVYLYNLDDLAKIADENRAAREAEIEKCRQILTHRTEALWRQISGSAYPDGSLSGSVRLSGQ